MPSICPTCGHESKGPPRSKLSADYVREILAYEPATGVFRWRVKRLRAKICDIATGPDGQGYLRITIGSERHRAHRLAWLYVNGEWPEIGIDHKNRDRSDNRIDNLRLATKSQNGANSKDRNNSTGYRGVAMDKGKFYSRFRVGGKVKVLGPFLTAEEASFSYKCATAVIYGEFSH